MTLKEEDTAAHSKQNIFDIKHTDSNTEEQHWNIKKRCKNIKHMFLPIFYLNHKETRKQNIESYTVQ